MGQIPICRWVGGGSLWQKDRAMAKFMLLGHSKKPSLLCAHNPSSNRVTRNVPRREGQKQNTVQNPCCSFNYVSSDYILIKPMQVYSWFTNPWVQIWHMVLTCLSYCFQAWYNVLFQLYLFLASKEPQKSYSLRLDRESSVISLDFCTCSTFGHAVKISDQNLIHCSFYFSLFSVF